MKKEARKAVQRKELAEELASLYSISVTEATRRIDGVMGVIVKNVLEGNDVTIAGTMTLKHNMIAERTTRLFGREEPKTFPPVRTVDIQLARGLKKELQKLGVDDLE